MPEHPETRANIREVERCETKLEIEKLMGDALTGMTREEIIV
ncbi:MAG: hypothetical protein AAB630_00695 [Patescibacteria group bacterium]